MEAESQPDPTRAISRDLAFLKSEVWRVNSKWASFWVGRLATDTPKRSNEALEKKKSAELKKAIVDEFRSLGKGTLESPYFAAEETRLKVLAALAYEKTRSVRGNITGSPSGRRPDGAGQFCWMVAADIICQIKGTAVHNDDGEGGQRDKRFAWTIPFSMMAHMRIGRPLKM
jgi:hypothetical protein